MVNFQRTGSTYREQDDRSTTWTVSDILRHYIAGMFGIPHFQRGLVWDDVMLGALLESLYFDTPCGAIVLWKPDSQQLRDHGLPIGPHAADGKLRYLLVDGQQRVRSLGKVSGLLEALRDHECNEAPVTACGGEKRDWSTGEPRVWCVNLVRTPQFQVLVSHERELPLFLFTTDPGHPRLEHGSRCITRYHVVPVRELAMFKDLASWAPRETYLHRDLLTEEPRQVEEGLRAVRDALRAIPKREFFVRILEGVGFPEVVRVYNRINSTGKRVEAEERALATVSAIDPETDRRLRDMFTAVHGRDGESHDALLERDELLRRQRERTLGFKFLMRAFVQACAQHSQLSVEAATLSFDAVDRDSFRKAFANAHPDRRARVWDCAMRAVGCVARVLRNELFCDDFRFVPDAASLTPVMQLLIRFPDLAGDPSQSSSDRDAVVAALILRAFLEEPRDTHKAAEWVRRSNRPLGRIVERLRGGQAGATFDKKKLVDRLSQSNSLQDRYVLLLYWLIRRNRARDFSYLNLPDNRPDREPGCKGHQPGEERLVQASEKPEKQHIIPFSRIAPIVDDTPSRVRHGSANNIGNLTYISSALNSFDTGLGDRPIDPSLGGDMEGDNLRAHLLLPEREDARTTGEPLKAYLKAVRALELENPDRPAAASAFLDFCTRRRVLVAQAFLTWLEELDSRARRVPLDDVPSDVPWLIERESLGLGDTIRIRIRGAESPDLLLEGVLLRLVECIDVRRSLRCWRTRRVDPNRGAASFAVHVRRVAAGDGEHKKEPYQRTLLLRVEGTGMTIEPRILDERIRSAFDDLLTVLGQQTGSQRARVGVHEARSVDADAVADRFASLLDATASHPHAAELDPGA